MSKHSQLAVDFVPFQCKIVAHHNQFNVEGITSAQYNILDYLQKEGPKTARNISEGVGISISAVSKLTKKLLEKNLINQTRDEKDRRYYFHSITQEGVSFLQKAEKSRNEIIESIALALSENEVEQFTKLCRKINAELVKEKIIK